MAAKDPASLLNQASCYACFGTGLHLLELMLLQRWNSQQVIINPVVAAWQARAMANGGDPSPNTVAIVNTFWNTLVANSLDSRMLLLNCLVPDDKPSLLTPQVQGGGLQLWSDIYGNILPTNPSIINGLAGNQAGAINTGWIPSVGIPQTNDIGMSAYVSVADPSSGATIFGARDNTSTNQMWWYANIDVAFYDNGNPNGDMTSNVYPFTGFQSASVYPAGNGTMYAYGSTGPFGIIASNPTMPFGSPPAVQSMFMLAMHEANGQASTQSGARVSFIAVHRSLTQAQTQTLFNAVQTMRMAFGGGFV